jgi:hypothetical protein
LKKARDVFANDPQVAILSFHVSPPRDLKELKDKLAKIGVTWTQAVSADPKTPLDMAYQRGFNVSVIGPDGKVVAKNLRPESLDAELAKVLLERR